MKARKMYDDVIMTIENGASSQDIDDIMSSVVRSSGYGMRDLNAVIKFLTGSTQQEGSTLRDYIKERKLMAAYRYLISTNKPNIGVAVEISGFDNQSSFTKKFSSFFGVSPKEASQKKDVSLLTEPLTWEIISCDLVAPKLVELEVEEMDTKSRFGVSQEQYRKIMEASELEAVFGFEPMFSQVAFELSECLNIPMKKTFRFADELREFGGDFSEDDPDCEDDTTADERLRELAFDPFVQHMYFVCGLSVDLTYMTRDRIPLSEDKIMSLDAVMIHTYAHIEEMSFSYFKDAFDYYTRHSDENYSDMDYDEYVDMICRGIPKETAFDNLMQLGDDADASSDIQLMSFEREIGRLQEYDPIENMAAEAAQWNGIRIDGEYNEDDAPYDDTRGQGYLDF